MRIIEGWSHGFLQMSALMPEAKQVIGFLGTWMSLVFEEYRIGSMKRGKRRRRLLEGKCWRVAVWLLRLMQMAARCLTQMERMLRLRLRRSRRMSCRARELKVFLHTKYLVMETPLHRLKLCRSTMQTTKAPTQKKKTKTTMAPSW